MLTRGYNQLTKDYGAFHTGVEVYGRLEETKKLGDSRLLCLQPTMIGLLWLST